MPIDIFTEVASHLMPEDIIVLSRANKFFRKLLMQRSAVHIWHGVMRNVPELPPCPPDMCEPQYLSLIYMPNCSMCGGIGAKRMDGVLRVRLCNYCYTDRTMPAGDLPPDVQSLVHKSTPIGPQRSYDMWHSALRSDVGAVLVKMEELKMSGNGAALTKWKTKRLEEVAARKKQSAALDMFLDDLEAQEIRRQNNLKAERRAEIERRILLVGWDKKDIPAGNYNSGGWEVLVNQPVPITERIWADIKPKLFQILRINRTNRLAVEKTQRGLARRMKLEQIMAEIKAADPFIIDARIPSLMPRSSTEPNAPAVRVRHQRLFPLAVDLLEYPIIKGLDETDIPDSAMEARFEEHREVIKAHVLEWRIKIEGHLAGLLREGRVSDGLKKAAPAPKLPVGKSEPNPFNGLSDDLKLLLRADSLFDSKLGMHSFAVTYPSLLSSSLSNMWGLRRDKPLDLTSYKRYGKAQGIARALLAGLGKTNASFIEFNNTGQLFKCGRCQSKLVHSWEDMVHHYADEQRKWEKFQTYAPKAQEHEITFQNLHDLDAKPKKSLVTLVDMTQDSIDCDYDGPTNFQCLLCRKLGVTDDGVTEDEIIEHLNNW
ncbi:hypothetical protein BDV93DRAFT_529006 [Ceratobasidium sp. AG-I]|nr:hypothetical protein BDV93DRAFT_529006 [Ceratobasidium sp. AG-I]